MGLSDFEPATETIHFKSGKKDFSFAVRGLTLEDLSYLISEHLDDIEAGMELFQRVRNTIMSPGQFDAFVLTLCREAPLLVAEVISVAADERALVDKYVKVPFSVSGVALAAVVRLTLEDGGGLKNLSETLASLVKEALPESAREALASRMSGTTNSRGSIGESEET